MSNCNCSDKVKTLERVTTKTEKKIKAKKEEDFKKFSLFTAKESDAKTRDVRGEGKQFLTLAAEELKKLRSSTDKNIKITVPVPQVSNLKKRTLELLLQEDNIYSNDFKVLNGKGGVVSHKKGRHFYGIVKGHQKSLVVVNVYDTQVSGIISVNENTVFELSRENIVKENKTSYEVKKIIKGETKFRCLTDTRNKSMVKSQAVVGDNSGKCVRMFFDVYQNITEFFNGSVEDTAIYITDVFNAVRLIYKDDPDVGISLKLSGMQIYTTQDPLPFKLTPDIGVDVNLYAKYRNKEGFNGNIAELLLFSTPEITPSGVTPVLGDLCGNNPYSLNVLKSSEVSLNPPALNPPYPQYSWNASTIAHETGHVFGSNHTFDCVWDNPLPDSSLGGCGVSGTDPKYNCVPCIDANPIGDCSQPGATPQGLTIMGYCENYFPMRFGPQPGAVILDTFNSVTCLEDCEVCPVPPNISVTLFHNTRLNKCYHYREPIQITNGETYTFVTHKDCLKLEWEVTSDTTNTPITVQTAPYSGYHFPADFETLVIVLVTDSAGVTNHFTFKVKVVKDPSSKD